MATTSVSLTASPVSPETLEDALVAPEFAELLATPTAEAAPE
jgi:hypothetical protein